MRLLLAALAALTVAGPAAAQRDDDDYSAPRDATVDASGAKRVRVDARAGLLRVTGRPGIAEVRIKGTARASDRDLLADIKLEARREGDEVVIRVTMPEMRDRSGWGWNGDSYHRSLDLVVEVPQGAAMDILDSSGDIDVRGVGAIDLEDSSGNIEIVDASGPVDIEDSSGEIRVERVRGDVRLRDSSGDIIVRDVTGGVTVDDDSSGEIDVTDVTGTVHVRRDGSGSISVAKVGGDFRVDRDGGGEIDHRDVKGRVDVPEPRRRRRY